MARGIRSRRLADVFTLRISTLFNLVACLVLLVLALPAGAAAQTAHLRTGWQPVGGGFFGPTGVAADGNGNVFTSDPYLNVVKETPSGCFAASCVQVVGSGFNVPFGVAVDGSGNVFVADTGNNAVKEILAAGGYTTVNTLGSGFNEPEGVAVDGNGNVYVADLGNNAVKEILATGGYSTVNTLGSGFSQPLGVAVDAGGDVFVADSSNNAVKEIVAVGGSIPALPTIRILGSGFNSPDGVALDRSGNLFVADSDNNAVKELTAASGYASITTLLTLAVESIPRGVAVDRTGDVLVAVFETGQVLESSEGGTFGTVNVGSTSAVTSLTFMFDSAGNLGSAPSVLTQGSSGLDFADAGTGSCTTNGTSHVYNAGDGCTVDVTFTPNFAGQRNGAVVLSGSGGNAIATAYLQGTGSGPQVSFLPGSQSTLSLPNLVSGYAMAEDGAGNLYILETQGVQDGPNSSVVKETWTGSGYTQSTIATGLLFPVGIALDGAGNVWVADQDAEEILEFTPGNGGYAPGVTFFSPGFPEAIAVDGSGNIYFASDAGEVLKETPSAGGYVQSVVATASTFAMTVDGSGNLYLASFSPTNAVLKETVSAGSYTQSTVATYPTNPSGVAVDSSGSIYVALSGQIVKETPSGGTYTQSGVLQSPNGSNRGMILDSFGNLLFLNPEQNDSVWKLDLADPPSLNFGSIFVGESSAEQTVTVQNIGNAPLTLPVPAEGDNPSVAQSFALDSSASTACQVVTASSAPASLPPGSSCTLSISFDPTAAGNVNGSLIVTDNALNARAATQTIALQGTAPVAPTTTTLSAPAGTTFGSTILLTASVSSTAPGNIGGTVTFTVGSVTVGVVPVSGGQAALSVPVTATNGFTTGNDAITASYGGSADFAASSESATVATVTGTTTTVSAAPASVTLGASTTLTATVSSTPAGNIAGTVTFSMGDVVLGTAPVSGGVATLNTVPVNAANGFSVGSNVYSASYGGNTAYGLSSANATLTATAPTYTLSSVPLTLTATAGGSAAATLNLTSNYYAGTVSFATSITSVNGTAADMGAAAAAVTLTSGGSGSSTLTVTTNTSAQRRTPVVPWKSGGLLAFAVVLGAPFTLRRKRAVVVLLMAAAISLAGFAMSCGGSKAARVYTVTVTPTGTGTVTNPTPVSITLTVR